jgi:hypothetical protein
VVVTKCNGGLTEHKVLTGPRDTIPRLPGVAQIVRAEHAARQTTLVARVLGPVHHPAWTAENIGLEELILAHMRSPAPLPDHGGCAAEARSAKVYAL